MERIKLKNITPHQFFKEIQQRTGFSLDDLASLCGHHRRSLFD